MSNTNGIDTSGIHYGLASPNCLACGIDEKQDTHTQELLRVAMPESWKGPPIKALDICMFCFKRAWGALFPFTSKETTGSMSDEDYTKIEEKQRRYNRLTNEMDALKIIGRAKGMKI